MKKPKPKIEAWAVVDDEGFVHDAWTRQPEAEDAARSITCNTKLEARTVHLVQRDPAAERFLLAAVRLLHTHTKRHSGGEVPVLHTRRFEMDAERQFIERGQRYVRKHRRAQA